MKVIFSILLLTTISILVSSQYVSAQTPSGLVNPSMYPTRGPPGTIIDVFADECVSYYDAVGVWKSEFYVYLNGIDLDGEYAQGNKLHPDSNCFYQIALPLDSPPKTHVITICESNHYSTCPDKTEFFFQVTEPKILNPTPTNVIAGDVVQISGSGFPENLNVLLSIPVGDYSDPSWTIPNSNWESFLVTTEKNVKTDNNGSFTTNLDIPKIFVNDYFTIEAIWDRQHGSYPKIEYDLPVVNTRFDLQNPTPRYGDSLTVFGEGYSKNSLVSVFVNDQIKTSGQTDNNGMFTLSFTIEENPGTYTVRATDEIGYSDSKSVSVLEPASMSINFIASPTSGESPLNVSFTGTIDNGIPPYDYEFNPGDGSSTQTGTTQNTISLSHQFNNDGNFSPTLIVTDSQGQTELKSTNISVQTSSSTSSDLPPPPSPSIPPPSPSPTLPPPPPPPSLTPPPPSNSESGMGSLQITPDLDSYILDPREPIEIQFSGDIPNTKRGAVAILEITEPDGRKQDQRATIPTDSGHYSIPIKIWENWMPGKYTASVFYNDELVGSTDFNVKRAMPSPSSIPQDIARTPAIPDWLKNNARWWSQNQIDDAAFANGIEYMLKNGLITIPGYEDISSGMSGVDPNLRIPDWIKTSIGFWSEGQISDEEALNSIEYLVENKIIDLKGERRADALGISSPPISKIDQIKDQLTDDGTLDKSEIAFMQILEILSENNVDINNLLNQDSFLKIIFSKVRSDNIDLEELQNFANEFESYFEDGILTEGEKDYLKLAVEFL